MMNEKVALNAQPVRANEKPQLSHGGSSHRQTSDTDQQMKVSGQGRHRI